MPTLIRIIIELTGSASIKQTFIVLSIAIAVIFYLKS